MTMTNQLLLPLQKQVVRQKEVHQCERCGLLLENISFERFQVPWSHCKLCRHSIMGEWLE
jgi:hypothetical protein